MHTVPINYLPLAIAVIAKMILGALWYSPVLFLKPWMALAGVTEAQMKARMPKALVSDLVGTVIMAIVLAHAVAFAGAAGAAQGAVIGAVNWLGFIAVTTFAAMLYEHRPFKIWAINNGFQLVGLIIMGAILAGWP